MKEIYFVTGNKRKVEEIAKILKPFNVKPIHKNVKIIEPDIESIEETAISKAQQAFAKLKKPVITEDTGLYFKAFNNFPGSSPKKVFQELGFTGILKLLKGKNRQAVFKTVICFLEGKNKFKTFEGRMKGRITTKVFKPVKKQFPYESIFIPEGKKKPVIRLSLVEKNELSHRGKAARKLGKFLQE
jgi:non-canonical purine NTP pyrophosphatase (RdgB/HAM1 family)